MSKVIGIFVVASALTLVGCGGGGGSGGGGNAADIQLSAPDQVKAKSLSDCMMANSTSADQEDVRSLMSASLNGGSDEAAKNRFALRSVGVAMNQCGMPASEGSQPYFKRAMYDYTNALAARLI